MATDLRQSIDANIAAGKAREAIAGLRELWRLESSAATARFVVDRFEKLGNSAELTPYRLVILRSYTVEPLVALLRAEAFVAGIDLSVRLGEFNVWAQEIYDADSELYSSAPDAVILALEEPDPSAIAEALTALRSRSDAVVIVHNRALPVWPRRGLHDAQSEDSEREAAHAANRELRQAIAEFRGAYVLDYAALVARHGAQQWRDERKWTSARLPMSSANMPALVAEWMRFLHPLAGKVAKCAVVDLDNTLWGGVIGEDGLTGIKLDDAIPGAFHLALQRALLDLKSRGVLLAVCSKNNPEDALEALEKHPAMLLRPSDFAALRINWQEKAQNLEEIAAELNIGVDALAFIDDNPVERQNIRLRLPQVSVIELPEAPETYAETVLSCPLFERLDLTAEDAARSETYAAQRLRRDAQASSSTPEDFLRTLEQSIRIEAVSPMTLARAAQLTQKTNQFNLTTRRYTEQQIATMAERPELDVLTLGVSDRFGDNGLTGLAITERLGDTCEIDTLLLSCRVIGRSVETALLANIEASARRAGCTVLRGRFIPTKKNAPASDFFSNHGFTPAGADGDASIWERDLRALEPLETPDWARVEEPAEVAG